MNRIGKYLALVGVGLQFGLLLHFIAIVVFAVNGFNAIAAGGPDVNSVLDANRLLIDRGATIGQIMAFAGIPFILAALFVVRYEKRWFYFASWAVCAFWLALARRSYGIFFVPFFSWTKYGTVWRLLGLMLAICIATRWRKRKTEVKDREHVSGI